ncbi:FAD-binding protein [Haloarchaeobius amylolyticus]|uniref:FAD-binding protein n=1 Tax=Haloarchaeobius amylolyticus TaxID=1198296 RepID=A0ABD6BNQ3_9EURY
MNLFEEGTFDGLETSTRGVFRPVRTRFVDDGVPSTELAAHLAARAAGGAGLIVGPAQMLAHSSASGPSFIDAYADRAVTGLSNVADAVHETGTPIVGQLTHTGAEETGDWRMQPQLAPSPAASDATYEMPKPMSHAEIDDVIAGFGTAAANLERAGFDGVELAAGPFSVLRQFLSPRYNTREDEYGGDWCGRARFVNEALAAVGDRTTGPVGLHLSLAELEYGGYEFEDVPAILDALEGYDYLSCTLGTRATYHMTHAGVGATPPDLREPIETVVDIVDVPVMGRLPFTSVDDAADLFEAGVDFVSFTRQLLADAKTLEKARADQRFDRCIQCNQKCLEGVYGHAHGGHVECVVDPRTGRETQLPPLADEEPAAIPQTVLIVGGGVAGMRFAAVATHRGHDVTIREASDSLGGQLEFAANGAFEPFRRSLEDLEAAVIDAGVTVELETPVTAADVDPSWDAVVVATGATPPDVDEYDFEGEVVNAFDVLTGAEVGEDVLLFDDNRWVITIQTGLELLSRDQDVEMVSRDHYPGFRTEQPNLPEFVAQLQRRGATFTGNHTLDAVDAAGTATLRNTLTGDRETRSPDTVVVVGRRHADEDLYLELDSQRDSVYRIGDAVSPRKLDRAYYDGEMLGRRL